MRRIVKSTDIRLPITTQLLERIIESLPGVCINTFETKLLTAAFTLAFFGFFRIGEITASKRGANTSFIVNVNDIQLSKTPAFAIINLRYSKTDQLGRGIAIKILCTGGDLCAVCSLRAYLNVRPPHSGPLFIHFNGSSLTRYQFSAVLKKTISRLGLDYSRFKSHSFRIGAATAATQLGLPVDIIKQAGRWSSKAYQSYIRPSNIVIPKLIK